MPSGQDSPGGVGHFRRPAVRRLACGPMPTASSWSVACSVTDPVEDPGPGQRVKKPNTVWQGGKPAGTVALWPAASRPADRVGGEPFGQRHQGQRRGVWVEGGGDVSGLLVAGDEVGHLTVEVGVQEVAPADDSIHGIGDGAQRGCLVQRLMCLSQGQQVLVLLVGLDAADQIPNVGGHTFDLIRREHPCRLRLAEAADRCRVMVGSHRSGRIPGPARASGCPFLGLSLAVLLLFPHTRVCRHASPRSCALPPGISPCHQPPTPRSTEGPHHDEAVHSHRRPRLR